MRNFRIWGAMLLTVLLIGMGIWWATATIKEQNDRLNQNDAFVYSSNGMLYWFELTIRKGKVDGNLHQQKLLEGDGAMPSIEEEIFPLTGELTDKGYEFYVHNNGKTTKYTAWFSGPHLAVQKQGGKDQVLYNPVKRKELDGYIQALLHYHDEERENNRLRTFFSELRQEYGYLHTAKGGSYQLFIKIDEALLEGELTGSLIMWVKTKDKSQPYKETRYALNGITDGKMVEFYTTVDNKRVKMTGNFLDGAQSFTLSFWKTDKQLTFNAISKETYLSLPSFR